MEAAADSTGTEVDILPEMSSIIPVMGTILAKAPTASRPSALAGALFTPVQQRVLGLLFGQPNRQFQSAELIRLVDSGTGATHRVLKRLAACGLVRINESGRQKYYQANPHSPICEELVGLIRKTVGLAGPLREALEPFVEDIRAAFVFGSVAEGRDRADSDIDLMVVAESLDYPALYEALQSAEQALGRSVNPNLVSSSQWRRRQHRKDSFIARMAARPRLFLVGTEDDLRQA